MTSKKQAKKAEAVFMANKTTALSGKDGVNNRERAVEKVANTDEMQEVWGELDGKGSIAGHSVLVDLNHVMIDGVGMHIQNHAIRLPTRDDVHVVIGSEHVREVAATRRHIRAQNECQAEVLVRHNVGLVLHRSSQIGLSQLQHHRDTRNEDVHRGLLLHGGSRDRGHHVVIQRDIKLRSVLHDAQSNVHSQMARVHHKVLLLHSHIPSIIRQHVAARDLHRRVKRHVHGRAALASALVRQRVGGLGNLHHHQRRARGVVEDAARARNKADEVDHSGSRSIHQHAVQLRSIDRQVDILATERQVVHLAAILRKARHVHHKGVVRYKQVFVRAPALQGARARHDAAHVDRNHVLRVGPLAPVRKQHASLDVNVAATNAGRIQHEHVH